MRRLLIQLIGAAVMVALATQVQADTWQPVPSNRLAKTSARLGRPVTETGQILQVRLSARTVPSRARAMKHRAARLAAPVKVRAQGPSAAEEQYNHGVVTQPPPTDPYLGGPPATAPGWGLPVPSWPPASYWEETFSYPGTFLSDHCFDSFISPVSNPFFFEDPRALTEVRPILMYQKFPGKFRSFVDLSNGNVRSFSGGNAFFLGLQARLAINQRLSFVVHELGWLWMQPDGLGPTALPDANGFAEIAFGPKFTLYRDDCSNTLAAVGLNFEIATGSDSVFQDTGSGGVTPYLTVGQQLGQNWHVLGTIGYRFRFSDSRSELFFTGLHVDYSIFDRVYPLVELNWYHYTRNGQARAANFEGQDLFMLGSNNVSGNDIVTLAAGVRFKITEAVQAGIVYEFPITKQDDLLRYRITADVIYRY